MPHFVSTIEMLAALKTACAALALGDKPLFQEVRYFHTPDLTRALRELAVQKKRACFLVPSGDLFENARAGRDLHSECTRAIVMLITDQTVSGAAAATFGDANNPGVVRIKDAVIEALLGQNLSLEPVLVRLRPVDSSSVLISIEDQKNQPGRQAWQITWHADAGTTSVSVPL